MVLTVLCERLGGASIHNNIEILLEGDGGKASKIGYILPTSNGRRYSLSPFFNSLLARIHGNYRLIPSPTQILNGPESRSSVKERNSCAGKAL